MHTLYIILWVISLMCFLGGAYSQTVSRIHLVALGLFFWLMVPFLQLVR